MNSHDTRNDADKRDEGFAERPEDSDTAPGPEPPASYKPADATHAIDEQGQDARTQYGTNPEPGPARYNVGPTGSMNRRRSAEEEQLFASARRLVSIAQICAIVSLFIGGIVLSTVAIVLAAMSYNKFTTIARMHVNDPTAAMLARPAKAAIAMGVIALVANIVSLALVFPALMQALQTGDISGLLAGGSSASQSPSVSDSTWG